MSEETKTSEPGLVPQEPVVKAFSAQPTGMVETTFAETLGLSMHNAVLSQQNAQMVTQASITNACARILTIPSRSVPTPIEKPQYNQTEDATIVSVSEPAKQKKAEQLKKLSISNFFGGNKDGVDEPSDGKNTSASSNNNGN